MWRKAALSIGVLAVAAVPGSAVASAARHEKVIVIKPTLGGPMTRFELSFSAPERTGRTPLGQRSFQVTANGPFENGCVSSVYVQVPPTRAGARVKITLDPSEHGGTWCTGDYHGRVDLVQTDLCPDDLLCPQYVIVQGKVGMFEFRVARGGADASAAGFPRSAN